MKFEIKHRYSGNVLLSMDTESIKLCVEAAVKSRANLNGANLSWADLSRANLNGADLSWANLNGADLSRANLSRADLNGADLSWANLNGANLNGADLSRANLNGANLNGANLNGADLNGANLNGADLSRANLNGANLNGADLSRANLNGANLSWEKKLVKIMGVEPGNTYWKRFDGGLNNNGYQFRVGLNVLRDGEIFADDERVVCGYPGFHFASRSWCAAYYPQRPLEARIRIPLDAKICEPWATDGKASADRIEILQVFDVTTGEDVTEKYR